MECKFLACKYLDYEPHYHPCKRQLIGSEPKVFWFRSHQTDNAMVQFCSRRGRLNHPESCLSKENAMCADYSEEMRTVQIPDEEINP